MARWGTVAALVCWSATVVAAQGLQSDSASGVFGATAESKSRSSLDLTLSVSEAFDSDAPPELRSRIQVQSPQSGGYSTAFKGTAEFQQNGKRLQLSSRAFSAIQYYPSLDRVVSLAHSGDVQLSVPLARHSTFDASQTVAYSPTYMYRLFPSIADPQTDEGLDGAPDYRTDESRSVSEVTRVGLASGSDRSFRASGSVEHNRTDFYGGVARADVATTSARGSLSRGLGRTGSISAEYEYRAGRFGYGGEGIEHSVWFGAAYAPALSKSRRLVIALGVAPSVTRFTDEAANSGTDRLYRIQGNASVRYPFVWKWTAEGSFRREVQYIPVLNVPVFTDGAQLGLSGLIGERVEAGGSFGYVSGASVFDPDGEGLKSYTGTVRVRFGLSRSVAPFVDYLYYHYDLRGQSSLAPQLPRDFQQHGVRVGLTLWARPVGR